MFRLASFLGVACLALAACALAGVSAKPSADVPPEPNDTPEPNPARAQLPGTPHRLFHAQFSVN
jgi:hypothetical protein